MTTGATVSLTSEQVDALLAPLDPRRVRQVQGNAHLEAWDVRRHLLRVFGWGGWDFHVVSCDCISERSKWDEQNPLKGRHTVVYRVVGRLTIRDTDGRVLATFEDGATGDAVNQPSLGDAHDMALKTAMSQALKRCAMNLGDRFGLSLYAKGSTAAVVGKSLAHVHAIVEAPVQEAVEGGEMAEHQDPPERPAERVKAPKTDAAWYADWKRRVGEATAADSVGQLRGLYTEAVEQARQGHLTEYDGNDARELIERSVAEVQARLANPAHQDTLDGAA